jgi:hypothetical protein
MKLNDDGTALEPSELAARSAVADPAIMSLAALGWLMS